MFVLLGFDPGLPDPHRDFYGKYCIRDMTSIFVARTVEVSESIVQRKS